MQVAVGIQPEMIGLACRCRKPSSIPFLNVRMRLRADSMMGITQKQAFLSSLKQGGLRANIPM